MDAPFASTSCLSTTNKNSWLRILPKNATRRTRKRDHELTLHIIVIVMIQSFQDEFELLEGKASNTRAIPRTLMSEGELKNQANDETQSTLSIRSWKTTSHDGMDSIRIMNAVREISRFAGRALQSHAIAMYQVMNYCRSTPER